MTPGSTFQLKLGKRGSLTPHFADACQAAPAGSLRRRKRKYKETKADEIVRDVDLIRDAVGGKETGRFPKTLKRGGALFPVFPMGFADQDEADRLGIKVSSTQVRSNGP